MDNAAGIIKQIDKLAEDLMECIAQTGVKLDFDDKTELKRGIIGSVVASMRGSLRKKLPANYVRQVHVEPNAFDMAFVRVVEAGGIPNTKNESEIDRAGSAHRLMHQFKAKKLTPF